MKRRSDPPAVGVLALPADGEVNLLLAQLVAKGYLERPLRQKSMYTAIVKLLNNDPPMTDDQNVSIVKLLTCWLSLLNGLSCSTEQMALYGQCMDAEQETNLECRAAKNANTLTAVVYIEVHNNRLERQLIKVNAHIVPPMSAPDDEAARGSIKKQTKPKQNKTNQFLQVQLTMQRGGGFVQEGFLV
jgi:hypothetical protein